MRISDWISDVCSSDRPGPEAKQPGVGHLQDAADIGGLVAVEIEIGRRGIGVSAVAPVQHPQRDERIEEVAGAPFMEPEPPPQRLAVERSRSKLGAQAELDGPQQSLPATDAAADLHDGIGRSYRFF